MRFWQLEGKYVGIAFPFGIVLFILFYFDANVSVSGTTDHSNIRRSLPKAPSFHFANPLRFTGTFSYLESRPLLLDYLAFPRRTVSSRRHHCIPPPSW